MAHGRGPLTRTPAFPLPWRGPQTSLEDIYIGTSRHRQTQRKSQWGGTPVTLPNSTRCLFVKIFWPLRPKSSLAVTSMLRCSRMDETVNRLRENQPTFWGRPTKPGETLASKPLAYVIGTGGYVFQYGAGRLWKNTFRTLLSCWPHAAGTPTTWWPE